MTNGKRESIGQIFEFYSDFAQPQAAQFMPCPRRFPSPWTTPYFSILIVRVVVAPHFLQAYVKSHRSVSSETATGGDGVIGRLQPGQVTVG